METTNLHHSDPHAPGALPQPTAGSEKLPGIHHIVAVGSGKGGVGKSTLCVNLALALQQLGARVGLVDADILGPSIPGMLGIPTGQPPAQTPEGRMIPAERHGLKVVSMGMLTGDDNPAVLRGPMVGKYLKMFVGGVQWGLLDYLLLDLPPGTGDTQLTLAQCMPLSGVVIVTMPQDVRRIHGSKVTCRTRSGFGCRNRGGSCSSARNTVRIMRSRSKRRQIEAFAARSGACRQV